MRPRLVCRDCKDPDRPISIYDEDDRPVPLCRRCATIALNLGESVTLIVPDVPMASRSTFEVSPSTEAGE